MGGFIGKTTREFGSDAVGSLTQELRNTQDLADRRVQDVLNEMKEVRKVTEPVLREAGEILTQWNRSAVYNLITSASEDELASLVRAAKTSGVILVGANAVTAVASVVTAAASVVQMYQLAQLRDKVQDGFRRVVSAVDAVADSVEVGNVQQRILADQLTTRLFLVNDEIAMEHDKIACIGRAQRIAKPQVTVMTPLYRVQGIPKCSATISTLWLEGGVLPHGGSAQLNMDESANVQVYDAPINWSDKAAHSSRVLRISGLRLHKAGQQPLIVLPAVDTVDHLLIDCCELRTSTLFSDGHVKELVMAGVLLRNVQISNTRTSFRVGQVSLTDVKYVNDHPQRGSWLLDIRGAQESTNVHMQRCAIDPLCWGTIADCASVVLAEQHLPRNMSLLIRRCLKVMLIHCFHLHEDSIKFEDIAESELLVVSSVVNLPLDLNNFPRFQCATFINCTFNKPVRKLLRWTKESLTPPLVYWRDISADDSIVRYGWTTSKSSVVNPW